MLLEDLIERANRNTTGTPITGGSSVKMPDMM